MVTQFWLAEKYLRVFCVMRRLIMKPVVVHPQGDLPSSIQDDFVEDPKLLRPVLGGLKITYIPKWVNQHDSFYLPEKLLNERVYDFSRDPVPLKSYTLRDRVTDCRRNLWSLPFRSVIMFKFYIRPWLGRLQLGLGNLTQRYCRILSAFSRRVHRAKRQNDKTIFKVK